MTETRGPLDVLLDQCEQIIEWHENLRMDTPGDEMVRLDAVAAARDALDQCHAIRNDLTGRDRTVPVCCARDALRAEIANSDGKYLGGYHGDENTAVKAAAILDVAQRRHPEHATTQPARWS